jgi:hypothetical protein
MKILGCILLLASVCTTTQGLSQPYLDIVNVRYQMSPQTGNSTREDLVNSFRYFNASFNVPVQFKKDSSVLVFSPFFDRWDIEVQSENVSPVHSIALPLTFIRRLNQRWTAAMTAIVRWNGHASGFVSQNFQAGGALLFTYQKRPKLSYKAGLYYNNEFFGHFFVPLVGIDWRIDDQNNLFGVLPGNLTFERKLSKWFYYGATFRAFSNSYKMDDQGLTGPPPFIRIEDNQVGAFADLYVSKGFLLNAEIAQSVFRRYRFGYEGDYRKYFFSPKIRESVVFKVAIAYRVRLRQ